MRCLHTQPAPPPNPLSLQSPQASPSLAAPSLISSSHPPSPPSLFLPWSLHACNTLPLSSSSSSFLFSSGLWWVCKEIRKVYWGVVFVLCAKFQYPTAFLYFEVELILVAPLSPLYQSSPSRSLPAPFSKVAIYQCLVGSYIQLWFHLSTFPRYSSHPPFSSHLLPLFIYFAHPQNQHYDIFVFMRSMPLVAFWEIPYSHVTKNNNFITSNLMSPN